MFAQSSVGMGCFSPTALINQMTLCGYFRLPSRYVRGSDSDSQHTCELLPDVIVHCSVHNLLKVGCLFNAFESGAVGQSFHYQKNSGEPVKISV
jgi:hypothetical protein